MTTSNFGGPSPPLIKKWGGSSPPAPQVLCLCIICVSIHTYFNYLYTVRQYKFHCYLQMTCHHLFQHNTLLLWLVLKLHLLHSWAEYNTVVTGLYWRNKCREVLIASEGTKCYLFLLISLSMRLLLDKKCLGV